MQDQQLPLGQIQKIYSTAHWVCMGIFDGSRRQYLYLGRGARYEGMTLGVAFPPAAMRVKDRFLEYLRAHLEDKRLVAWVKDELDRILLLKLSNESYFAFFWRGSQLYFLHYYTKEGQKKLFRSWRSSEKSELEPWQEIENEKDLFSFFDEVGRSLHEGSIFSKRKIEDYFEEQKNKSSEVGLSSSRKKFFLRKIERIENDLLKVKKWEEFRDQAEAALTYDERNLLYEKSKRLRQAQNLLQGRLSDTLKEKTQEELKPKRVAYDDKIISPVFDKQESKIEQKTIAQKTNHQIEIFQFQKIKMAVGTSASGNDYLRREWANKEDWWFHMEGERSAHVVIKIKNISEIETDLYDLIGSMIRDYSQSTFEEIPLIFAQVKNLKGIKGTQGSVIISRPRYRRVLYKKDWKAKFYTFS